MVSFDYSQWECIDAVQKEFKEAGAEGLAWKTLWLDLHVGLQLWYGYHDWARTHGRREELPKKERSFYENIAKGLVGEFMRQKKIMSRTHSDMLVRRRMLERCLNLWSQSRRERQPRRGGRSNLRTRDSTMDSL